MRLNDEGARRASRQARHPIVDLRLPLVRNEAILPLRYDPGAARDELSLSEILAAARAAGERPGAFVIGGGDPMRRSDLGEIVAELARLRPAHLGLYTAGHGVTTAVAQSLAAAGVKRVQVPFHCARQDAHDWLVGEAGALKTAHRAIRACVDAGLSVAADIVLTRPTTAHLAETVEVLARTGVRAACVRRLTAHDTPGPEFVPLSPRLSLLEPGLEHAASVALARRLRLSLRDLPLCVAPRLRALFAAPDSERWVLADGSVETRARPGLGCASCPGWPKCAGAPEDYASRFGWEEFRNRTPTAVRVRESVEDQQRQSAAQPMTFGWRGPQRVRCEACADAPYEASSIQHAHEPTRPVRARLVEAALYRPDSLRLVGA